MGEERGNGRENMKKDYNKKKKENKSSDKGIIITRTMERGQGGTLRGRFSKVKHLALRVCRRSSKSQRLPLSSAFYLSPTEQSKILEAEVEAQVEGCHLWVRPRHRHELLTILIELLAECDGAWKGTEYIRVRRYMYL
jgi:hypothetical protein